MSFRPFLLVLALLLSLSPLPAPAQGDGAVEELERLVQTLENEAERNKLVGQLKQLIAAHKGIEPENDIIVDDVLIKVVSDRMVEAGQSLALFASQFRDLTRLGDWLIAQFATEDGKAFWLTALIEVILVVGVGVIAGKAADWSVARLQHRLRERRPTTW
ncbi:MAG: hypothetical protein FJX47_15375, partial [Alphaproteobacteria bacterium]|nr:hypothetical protein [Alphaproteobacteria bacterium]